MSTDWRDAIHEAGARALERYAHLTDLEVRDLASEGKISPYTAQYVIATRKGEDVSATSRAEPS